MSEFLATYCMIGAVRFLFISDEFIGEIMDGQLRDVGEMIGPYLACIVAIMMCIVAWPYHLLLYIKYK